MEGKLLTINHSNTKSYTLTQKLKKNLLDKKSWFISLFKKTLSKLNFIITLTQKLTLTQNILTINEKIKKR